MASAAERKVKTAHHARIVRTFGLSLCLVGFALRLCSSVSVSFAFGFSFVSASLGVGSSSS
jgi:hypothetical protein